jgi:hypothetical protein
MYLFSLNSLWIFKASYRRGKSKEITHSGMGTSEKIKLNWFAYKAMEFLGNRYTPRTTKNTTKVRGINNTHIIIIITIINIILQINNNNNKKKKYIIIYSVVTYNHLALQYSANVSRICLTFSADLRGKFRIGRNELNFLESFLHVPSIICTSCSQLI